MEKRQVLSFKKGKDTKTLTIGERIYTMPEK